MFNLFKKIETISTQQLSEKLTRNTLLVDVRTPEEYRRGHINHARNIPLNTLDKFNEESNKTIYLICQSGLRSKKAAKLLNKKGYKAVNIRGGMNHWAGKTKGSK